MGILCDSRAHVYRAAREIFAGDRTDFQRILVVVAHKPRATTSRHINMLRHTPKLASQHVSHHLSLQHGTEQTHNPAVYILINTPSLLVLIFLPHLSRATTARSDAFCR